MLSIRREGNDIHVKLTYNCLKNWCLTFKHSTQSEVEAELSVKDFNKNMYDSLEEIRRQEYEQGWKDAKAKRAKKSYFRIGWYIK